MSWLGRVQSERALERPMAVSVARHDMGTAANPRCSRSCAAESARAEKLRHVRRLRQCSQKAMFTAYASLMPQATVSSLCFTQSRLHIRLTDGREVDVAIDCYPRLRDASAEARSNWRLIGRGQGIHWEKLDEDLSVAGFLERASIV